MKLKRYQSGFTLMELLVIIAIISFLVAAILLALQNARGKARDARRVADIKQIANGLDVFYANCGTYPIESPAITLTEAQALFTGSTSGCGGKTGEAAGEGGIGPKANASGNVIVSPLKSAPLPADGTCTDTQGSNQYTYTAASPGSTYTLTFCLGRATGGYTSAGVKTITP